MHIAYIFICWLFFVWLLLLSMSSMAAAAAAFEFKHFVRRARVSNAAIPLLVHALAHVCIEIYWFLFNDGDVVVEDGRLRLHRRRRRRCALNLNVFIN